MDVRRRLSAAGASWRPAAAAAVLAATLATAAPALAQSPSAPGSTAPGIELSDDLPNRPDGYEMRARDAIEVANGDPAVIETRDRWGDLEATAEATFPDTWEIGYVAEGDERAQVRSSTRPAR